LGAIRNTPAEGDSAPGDSKTERGIHFEDYVVPVQWRKMLNHDEHGKPHPRKRFRPHEKFYTMADIVNVTSPIHAGAFLFPYFMRCPLYKKDLVYRQRFQFWELSILLEKTLPRDEHGEFMLVLRQKGDHKRLSIPDLRRYEIGVK
jgi:hypothetical protein